MASSFPKFKELPIDVAFMILLLSDNLVLQYDNEPPPLLLALASDKELKDVYHEAQRIYRTINLRVDILNVENVKILPLKERKMFNHILFVEASGYNNSCLPIRGHRLCASNNLETISIDLSAEVNYSLHTKHDASMALVKYLRKVSDRLTKISIRLPTFVLDEKSRPVPVELWETWRKQFLWIARMKFGLDERLETVSRGCEVWVWEDKGRIIGLRKTK